MKNKSIKFNRGRGHNLNECQIGYDINSRSDEVYLLIREMGS